MHTSILAPRAPFCFSFLLASAPLLCSGLPLLTQPKNPLSTLRVCGWGDIDACSQPVRDAMFSVLQQDEIKFGSVRKNALDMVDPHPSDTVLDVGSGLGGDAIEFAQKGARVLGVDASASVIEHAQKRLADRDYNLSISFRRVREEDLLSVFDESKFDCVYAQRLLQHVDSPRSTISRLAQVVKVGQGKVVIAEPDWGTYVIDHPNRFLAHKIADLFRQQITNPYIGRKLRRLLREAGLTKLALRAVPVVFVDPDASGLANAVRDFVDEGLLSNIEASEFMDAVDQMREEAAFTSTLTMFIVRAYRPHGSIRAPESAKLPLTRNLREGLTHKSVNGHPSVRVLPVPNAQVQTDVAKTEHSVHEKKVTPQSSVLPLNEMKGIFQADEDEGLVKLPQ